MANSHRYIFTNARRRADFNLDNASDDLQTIARNFPTLFELLEKHCATYSGDVVAESVMVAEATPGAAHSHAAADQGHAVCRTHSALWHCENERLPYGLIKRYLRAKFARDFAERAELIAAAGRATLLINDAIFDHGEEPLKLPKHVCDMLNSNKLTEQRSTAQLYKFLAGVRNALQRAAPLTGGFRLHSTVVEHAASVAGVDRRALPSRIFPDNCVNSLADAWCYETLTFRTRQLQRAYKAAVAEACNAALDGTVKAIKTAAANGELDAAAPESDAAAPESDAAGDAAAPESDAAGEQLAQQLKAADKRKHELQAELAELDERMQQLQGATVACNLDGSKLTGESVQAYLDQLQTAADAGAAARATQQLLQRAYDALDAVQASTGQTLAELIDPAEHADDAAIDKVPNLLADLYDQLWAMERDEN